MSSAGASGASAGIDFRIVVLPTVIAQTMVQASEHTFTALDVERGYVDLDGATSLRLASKDDSGYTLSVSFDPRVLSRVLLRIQRQTVLAEAAGRSIHVEERRMVDAPGEDRLPAVPRADDAGGNVCVADCGGVRGEDLMEVQRLI